MKRDDERLSGGVPRDMLGVSTNAIPVYTYKDLDIAFSTTLLQTLFYRWDSLFVTFHPQPVSPDGKGAFSALGDMNGTSLVSGAGGVPGVTVSGNPSRGIRPCRDFPWRWYARIQEATAPPWRTQKAIQTSAGRCSGNPFRRLATLRWA